MTKANISFVVKVYKESSLYMQFVVFYDTGVCKTYSIGTVPKTVKEYMENSEWVSTKNGRMVTVTYTND